MRRLPAGWKQLLAYTGPVLLLLVLAFIVDRHGRIPYPDPRNASIEDDYRYIAMALRPFSSDPLVHDAPYCWRLLTPLIVHLLPLRVFSGFSLVTGASLVATTLGTMWFMREMGLPQPAAVAGGYAFVVLGPATGFTLWDYPLIDPLSFALLVLALVFAVRREGLWLVATLIVSAVAKETVLFAALFAIVWALEQRDWRFLRWAAGEFVASVVVLVALRVAIPSEQPYSLLAEMHRVSANYAPTFFAGWQRFVAATIGTWGLLLPLAVLQLFHSPRFAASPAWVLLFLASLAQIVIATNVERTVVYSFPVVIAAAAAEVEYLAARYQFSRWVIWLPVLLLELSWWAYFAGFDSFGALMDYTVQRLDRLQSMEVMLAVTALIILVGSGASLFKAMLRRKPPTSGEAHVEQVPIPAVARVLPAQPDTAAD